MSYITRNAILRRIAMNKFLEGIGTIAVAYIFGLGIGALILMVIK
jgi:hypothetical protein